MPDTSTVKNHYNRFPYPKADTIEWNEWLQWELNTIAGLWSTKPIPENARILVAGCGTREAIYWAKSFPKATVYGVDLSETSIAITQSLIDQLSLTNVKVERRSLLDLNQEDGKFDLISSYGVLHHLPDPLAGLNALKKLLKPKAVLQLMFYNQRGRYYLHEFQKMVQMLSPEQNDDERFETGKLLTEFCNATGTRMEQAWGHAKKSLENDVSDWADMFIHPLEHAYNLPRLFELLNQAEMEFICWRNPHRWYVEPRLQNPELVKRYQALSEKEKWEWADTLFMPIYEFFCAPEGDFVTDDSWKTDDEKLLSSIVHSPQFHKMEIEENKITNKITSGGYIGFESNPNQTQSIKINTPGDLHLIAHPVFKLLIEKFDGEVTLQNALNLTCREIGVSPEEIQETVLTMLRKLIDPHQALIIKPPLA